MTTIVKDVVKHIPFTTEDMVNDNVFMSGIKNYIILSLSELIQNGIGNHIDVISTPEATWEDFFKDQYLCGSGVDMAKSYVYLQTQIMFDTPQPNTLTLLQDKSKELLYRARLEFDLFYA